MSDIIYTYKNQVYANITNKCNCACTFCIRSQQDHIGESGNLWHNGDPTVKEIKAAIDACDFTGYDEFVFCGYGEPTCALDTLLEIAAYVKQNYHLPTRLNTNGLGNLQRGRNIVKDLAAVIDSISISMNAPDAETYYAVTRPRFDKAYQAMLDSARECNSVISHTQLSIVDVLSAEDIAKCQAIADQQGVYLKIRKYS